jgi:glycosyltransferase involved in cell wall biosynthesis
MASGIPEPKTVVMLSAVDWTFRVEQGSHIFARLFAAAGMRVIWVDPIPARFPRLSFWDLRRLLRRLGVGRPQGGAPGQTRPVPGNVTVVSPVVLPERNRALIRLNRLLFLPLLARRIRGLAQGPVIVHAWKCLDGYSWLMDRLAPALAVYCIIDNFVEESGAPAHFRATELAMAARADLVVVRAELMERRVRPVAKRVIFRDSAVDFEAFAAADKGPWSGTRVLGYFGMIANRLDFDLLDALTAAGFEVALLGPVRNSQERIDGNPRIRHLDAVPHAQVPEAIRDWDALLFPYRRNSYTEGITPMKLYEYFATGKPIVSVALPFTDRFQGQMYLGDTPEEFVRAARSIAERESPATYEARKAIAGGRTWRALFGEELELLRALLAEKAAPGPGSL